jgi:hypothetical protein
MCAVEPASPSPAAPRRSAEAGSGASWPARYTVYCASAPALVRAWMFGSDVPKTRVPGARSGAGTPAPARTTVPERSYSAAAIGRRTIQFGSAMKRNPLARRASGSGLEERAGLGVHGVQRRGMHFD